MRSQYDAPLTGRCESHSCSEEDHSGRCKKDGKLYAVWGGNISPEKPHEYYLCEEGVEIDSGSGFTVKELE